MILSSRLLKNRPVYAGLALENRFSFATVLAANLGCNRFRIMLIQNHVPSYCAPPSEVAVLFTRNWNLSRCPTTGPTSPLSRAGRRFRAAALHTETGFDQQHADSILCLILTQRPVNDRKSNKPEFSQNPPMFHNFHFP